MSLRMRGFGGPADWPLMAELVQADVGRHTHVVDLPYRFCSWAFDDAANCAIWEDAGGLALAWAVMQSPFWTIDYALHPAAPADALAQVLDWADRRAGELRGGPFGRPAWFINCLADDPAGQALERIGFRSQADVGDDSWTKVFFACAPGALPARRPLPAGFHIRPLAGAGEAEAYVALHRAVFQSENMTVGWRERTLAHPDYRPALDLVLTDERDQMAGFCVGWFSQRGPQHRPAGQIEPMGIRGDLRGRGMGQALLIECLHRLAEQGAESLFVETDNYRDAAFGLYSSVGFALSRDIVVYRKDYPAR